MENKVAVKTSVSNILRGKFVEAGDDSYIKLPNGINAGKIRVLGTISEKTISDKRTYGALALEDDNKKIQVRFFKEKIDSIDKFSVGDLIDVIGYVRKHEEEIYISPVIIAKIDDPGFIALRKLELVEQESNIPKEEVVENLTPVILAKVKELDTNSDGAEIEKVIESLNTYEDSKVLETIRALMHKGDLFEPKKGFVKGVD